MPKRRRRGHRRLASAPGEAAATTGREGYHGGPARLLASAEPLLTSGLPRVLGEGGLRDPSGASGTRSMHHPAPRRRMGRRWALGRDLRVAILRARRRSRGREPSATRCMATSERPHRLAAGEGRAAWNHPQDFNCVLTPWRVQHWLEARRTTLYRCAARPEVLPHQWDGMR